MASSLAPLYLSQRSRSADPFVRNYSTALRPYDHSRYDAKVRNTDIWLQHLVYESSSRNEDIENIAYEWASTCPATYSAGINSLTVVEVYNAFMVVIRHVQDAATDTTDNSSISHRILLDLEETKSYDDAQHVDSYTLGTQALSLHCQHLFRCFAEVSYRCRSRPLGLTLYRFFMLHADWIAVQACSTILTQWCEAVVRSELDLDMKRECILEVARHRPDVHISVPARSGIEGLESLLRELIETIRMKGIGNPLVQRGRCEACPLQAGHRRELLRWPRLSDVPSEELDAEIHRRSNSMNRVMALVDEDGRSSMDLFEASGMDMDHVPLTWQRNIRRRPRQYGNQLMLH